MLFFIFLLLNDAKLLGVRKDACPIVLRQIDAITQELNQIREARLNAKREAGGALYKKWDCNNTDNTIKDAAPLAASECSKKSTTNIE